MFDDGRHGGTGDWDGYLAFIQHPALAIALQGIALRDSDNEASSWLILDRQTRELFVARDAHELRNELTRSRRNEEEGGEKRGAWSLQWTKPLFGLWGVGTTDVAPSDLGRAHRD